MIIAPWFFRRRAADPEYPIPVGTLVRLRSGSPLMTIHNYDDDGQPTCV